jgi:hypothetical protein
MSQSEQPISLYEIIKEQLKDVNTENLSDDVKNDVEINISPEKVYFWTRVYLKDENPNIEIGDWIKIIWTPSGEFLRTQFITWGKKGLDRDSDGVVGWNSEDDKRVVCLMIDEHDINTNDGIPFIRTLFKLGRFHEENLIKRDELQFVIENNGILLEYYDCDF